MYGWTDGRTNGRTDGRMDRRTGRQTDRETDKWTDNIQPENTLIKFSVSRNFVENKFSRNSGSKLNSSRTRSRKRERENYEAQYESAQQKKSDFQSSLFKNINNFQHILALNFFQLFEKAFRLKINLETNYGQKKMKLNRLAFPWTKRVISLICKI